MRYTKKQFEAEYPNDDVCLEAVFQARFGHVKWCPKCGAETKFYRVKKRQCYACMHCSYQLFPLAGTIFRKTTTPLTDWFYAVYLFSVSKNGVAAKELERHLGVTYKTAWRMAKQIRVLMQQDADMLSGVVEADETYVGGKSNNERRFRNKTPVLGVVEKDGMAKAQVTDWLQEAVLCRLSEHTSKPEPNCILMNHVSTIGLKTNTTINRSIIVLKSMPKATYTLILLRAFGVRCVGRLTGLTTAFRRSICSFT